MTRPILTLVLFAGIVIVGPAEAAPRQVPEAFYGVNWNRSATIGSPDLHAEQFSVMAGSGVESVRVSFSWARAQRDKGSPPYLADADRVVALAAANGLEVVPVVTDTPGWAAAFPKRTDSPPARVRYYTRYLQALIGRYGPSGTFWAERPDLPLRPIRHWQIWNEPNMPGFWHVKRGSKEGWWPGYTALLRASYEAVKWADPGAKVILAGLSDFSWRHLKAIYRAGGRGYFDVVAINVFTSRPSYVLEAARLTRRVLRRHGERRKPIWVTETTWPASKGRATSKPRLYWQGAWETTDDGMAERLRELYALAARDWRRLRLRRVFWYTWATAYFGIDLFDYSGLLQSDGTVLARRPALDAYRASAFRDQGCPGLTAGPCR
jgi:hypothetical protein